MTPVFPLSKDREDSLEHEVGPPGFWYQTQKFHIAFLRSLGLLPHHQSVEIGCGVARGALPIISYLDSGRYVGIDIRESAIKTARELIGEFDLSYKRPNFHAASDFGDIYLGDNSQDVIFSFHVLYHLEDYLVRDFFRMAQRKIQSDGFVLANVHCIPPYVAGMWKEFPFIPRPLEDYVEWANEAGLDCKVLGQLKDFDFPDDVAGENHILYLTKQIVSAPVA